LQENKELASLIPKSEPADFSKDEELKFAVFCNLTGKNYWVTVGVKFGAEFLAYKGDPLTCHAHYMVRILKTPKLSLNELVLSERMAQSIKKDLLVVYDRKREEPLKKETILQEKDH